MDFENAVVIVTGAASGIGLATATRFAAGGARLVLADIDQHALTHAQQIVSQAGAHAVLAHVCDVSIESQVADTVEAATKNFGQLDVIVNNAGLMVFKRIEEQTEDDWMKVLKVDLLGAFFFIKYGFLNMQRGGAIVNVSSIHAIETEPLVAPYAAAKTALLSLTRSAALEGKSKSIRVNAVLPGAIDTPMLWNNPNVQSKRETIEPADVGKPQDVAAAIAYLASSDAKFINGAMLRVDGGRLDRL